MVPANEADEFLDRPCGIGHEISHLKGQMAPGADCFILTVSRGGCILAAGIGFTEVLRCVLARCGCDQDVCPPESFQIPASDHLGPT